MPAIRSNPLPSPHSSRAAELLRSQDQRAQAARAPRAQEPQAPQAEWHARDEFQTATSASQGAGQPPPTSAAEPHRPTVSAGGYSDDLASGVYSLEGGTAPSSGGYSDGAVSAGLAPNGQPLSAQPPTTAAPTAPPPPANPIVPTKEQREAIVSEAKANTTEEQQRAFLTGLGIPEKHLNDTYGDKLSHAFGETVDALLQPGDHKRSLKIDNQYDLNVEVGDNLELKSAEAAQDRDSSFFGKVLDKVAPFASTVGALLGPVTGGVSTVIGAAIGAVQSFRQGDWLGVVSSAAGGVGGFLGSAAKLTGGLGTLAASSGAKTIATTANFISKGADVLKNGLAAYETGSLGGLASAFSSGLGLAADGFGRAGEQFSGLADNLGRAARVTLNGGRAIEALNAGDYLGAAQNILGAGAVLTRPSPTQAQGALPATTTPSAPTLSDRLASASDIVGTVRQAKTAYETGDYTNLVAEGLRLAHQVSGNPSLGRAADIASPSAALITAINGGDFKGIASSAKKLYDAAAKFERLNLPKNPLDLAKNVLPAFAA